MTRITLFNVPDQLPILIREPAGDSRVFPNEIENANDTTVEGCLNQCAKFGYPAAGMEFGIQCCKQDLPTRNLPTTDMRPLQSVATPLLIPALPMSLIVICLALATPFICAVDRMFCRLAISPIIFEDILI